MCQKFQPSNPKEPLIPHEVPNHPWEKIAVDLFEFNKNTYLIVVDYYSKFFETVLLHKSNSSSIINHFKSIFARQGVPAQVISDRGPPFSSKELDLFYKSWNIDHKCSSPYYPRSNGLVEQTVKLVKGTLERCKEDQSDPYLAMLHLRNAHVDGQEPPSRLLNGRILRTNIPSHKQNFKTNPVPFSCYRKNNLRRIVNMKKHYDKSAKSLEHFSLNDPVFFQKKPGTEWMPAIIHKVPKDLRSERAYEIITPNGQVFCRNRIFLRKRCSREGNDNISDVKQEQESQGSVEQNGCQGFHHDWFEDNVNTSGGGILGAENSAQGIGDDSVVVIEETVNEENSEEILDETFLQRNLSAEETSETSLQDESFLSTLTHGDSTYQDDIVNDPDWEP